MPSGEVTSHRRVTRGAKIFIALLAAVLAVPLLVQALFFVLTYMGPTDARDWQSWYIGYGPSASSESAYVSDLEPQTSEGPDGTVTQVRRTWTTSSRTTAQACADFAEGIRELSSKRNPLGISARVHQENAADGGCTLTSSDGQVSVVVLRPASGSGTGADVAVTEIRP
jgi:hypothetical protein